MPDTQGIEALCDVSASIRIPVLWWGKDYSNLLLEETLAAWGLISDWPVLDQANPDVSDVVNTNQSSTAWSKSHVCGLELLSVDKIRKQRMAPALMEPTHSLGEGE